MAREIFESLADGEFFNKLPAVQDERDAIFYVAAEGDISTDLLSHCKGGSLSCGSRTSLSIFFFLKGHNLHENFVTTFCYKHFVC